jgi:hypothetical protein
VIAGVAGALLERLAARRRRKLEHVWRASAQSQEATLRWLVACARDTEFGYRHDFAAIRSVADYQARVPLRGYLDFRPFWQRTLQGEPDLTWPGRPRHWVKTSGTTAGDKVIPVTAEALASHRRGGWDALFMAVERAGGRHLLGGSLLFLGGTSRLAPIGDGGLVGDLSGLVVHRLPPGLRACYSPGAEIAAIPDWQTRIRRIAALAVGQDVRLLAGMPSWMLVLIEHVARHRDLGPCWPHLRVFIHGGVSFGPYRSALEQRLDRRLDYVEVYPASEGFVALQTERTGGLTLMLDYDIFYEFVPVEDLGAPRPRRATVADVELGRPYAVVLTTPAGLWSYILGDTVRFVARDPLRLEITGRTRHYVNAFGENVIVEEVERALLTACRTTGAEVVEFTVAPRYPTAVEARGGHDWLVEFRVAPADPAVFLRVLDETVSTLNTDYRIKRAGDLGLEAPRLITVPPGTFHRWLQRAGKLGDQHKVPRVTNDRTAADEVLALGQTSPGAFVPA